MPSTMDQMVEAGARDAYEAEHKGLRNCWSWDDQGLDDEHPMARERYRKASEAALRAALPMAIEAALRGAEGKSAEFDSQAALAECRDAEYGFHQGRVAVVAYIRSRLSEIMEGK